MAEKKVKEEVETMSLGQYLNKVGVNKGLVASFTYEASKGKDGLKDRTEAEWKTAFEAQSKRVYK